MASCLRFTGIRAGAHRVRAGCSRTADRMSALRIPLKHLLQNRDLARMIEIVLNDSVHRDINAGHALENRLIKSLFPDSRDRFTQGFMAAIESSFGLLPCC